MMLGGECKDLLIQFGGHKYAAGLTMEPENVEAFKARFEEVVSATISPEQLIQQIQIDAELRFKPDRTQIFPDPEPVGTFGPENMSPVFISKNVYVSGKAALSRHILKMR